MDLLPIELTPRWVRLKRCLRFTLSLLIRLEERPELRQVGAHARPKRPSIRPARSHGRSRSKFRAARSNQASVRERPERRLTI